MILQHNMVPWYGIFGDAKKSPQAQKWVPRMSPSPQGWFRYPYDITPSKVVMSINHTGMCKQKTDCQRGGQNIQGFPVNLGVEWKVFNQPVFIVVGIYHHPPKYGNTHRLSSLLKRIYAREFLGFRWSLPRMSFWSGLIEARNTRSHLASFLFWWVCQGILPK